MSIFYREAQPPSGHGNDKAPVILIHGHGGSSKKYLDIGTLHVVAAAGHRVIAIDLPGMKIIMVGTPLRRFVLYILFPNAVFHFCFFPKY